jgi:replication-associated recombination protein RarA
MLPEKLRGERFYVPSDNGYEKKIREHMASLTKDTRYTDPERLLPRPNSDHEE